MFFRKALVCCITIGLAAVFSFPSFASENNAAGGKITTTTEYSGDVFQWTFPYSDTFFAGADDEFCQELARSSMGLSVASVRDLSGVKNEGGIIDKYLCDAGFEDVDTSTYLAPTETDSIACGLGHKKIGDSTLVVVGVCSANYGKEWGGNLRVGNETDHAGFRIAADKLKKYLRDYEEQHEISGKKMLWITGFSRGAAVGNLLSGDLMRDGGYEKLFAYFFATPRNTREARPYGNIFNIIVKDDYVPTMPFAEWGYERNGTDLYTFSPASDTDIGEEIEALDNCGREMTGVYYYNNQSVGFMFRTIANFMCDLFDTSAEYTDSLQDMLIQIFDDGVSDDFFDELSEALSQLTFENPEKERALQGLIDYINYFTNDYVFRGYPEENGHVGWNSNVSFFENIKREHTIPRYSIWMMADMAPDRLFSTNMAFTRLILATDADLEVYDEFGLLETFDTKLTYCLLPDRPVRNQSYVDIIRSGNQLIVSVPYGREIRLVLKSKHPGIAQLITYDCSYDHVRYANGHMGMMNLNTSPCTLVFGPEYEDGFTVESKNESRIFPIELEKYFSTIDLIKAENDGVKMITLFDLGIILGSFLVLVILGIIVSVIFAVKRKRRKTERTASSVMIAHGLFASVCFVYALIIWNHFPGIYVLSTGFACLICGGISLLALRAFLMNRKKCALIIFLVSVPVGILVIRSTVYYVPYSSRSAIIALAGVAATFAAVCLLCFNTQKSDMQIQKQ